MYKEGTGLRCFMYVMGVVFARTAEEAEDIANYNTMRGDAAMKAHRELVSDYIAAQQRQGRLIDGRDLL
jgi:hypothetical protein